LLVEDKGLSLAVHYRQVPERADEVRRALQRCLDSAGKAFHLQPGKMVLEVMPGGSDKGTAILAFMAEAPFLHRLPVFLGDDVTDEHGFAMVHRLGGRAIKVGRGASLARERLADVAAVRAWLERMFEVANPTA
jgi:trehalose 6-phosphate phosphatase